VILLASSSFLSDQFLQPCRLNFCSFSYGSSLFWLACDPALVACDVLIINMSLGWSVIITVGLDPSCVIPMYK